jgi:zinc/manganese transport system permease protein
MVLASGIGFAACVVGLLASYHANLPSGPTIVLAAGALYAVSLALSDAWGRLAPIRGRGEA